MRSDEITRSAARLQHSVDTLCAQIGADHTTAFGLVLDLRLATVEHAIVLTELTQTARSILGEPEEIRCLLPLLDALFHVTDEIHQEVGHTSVPTPILTSMLVAICDELMLAESTLLCGCGTILFPAETS